MRGAANDTLEAGRRQAGQRGLQGAQRRPVPGLLRRARHRPGGRAPRLRAPFTWGRVAESQTARASAAVVQVRGRASRDRISAYCGLGKPVASCAGAASQARVKPEPGQ